MAQPKISLKALVEAIDGVGDEMHGYVDPVTGEVLLISAEDVGQLEGDEPADHQPEWQREFVEKNRPIFERWRPLPDQHARHDSAIMRRFADSCAPQHRARLFRALEGRGAYRRFREEAERLGVRERWFEHRRQELEAIAKEWLRSEELEWE